MRIKAVCFDIDGTLYPKSETNKRLIVSLFPSPLRAFRFNSFRKNERLKSINTVEKRTMEQFRSYQAAMIKSTIKQVDHQFYNRWLKSFANLKPYPTLLATLKKIEERELIICALSDFPVEQKLVDMKIDSFFKAAVCSEQSGYLKPHPHAFTYVAEQLGLQAKEILYVGDSYDKDMVGSYNLGMKNCYFVPGAKSVRLKKKYPKADVIIGKLEQLIEHLDTLLI